MATLDTFRHRPAGFSAARPAPTRPAAIPAANRRARALSADRPAPRVDAPRRIGAVCVVIGIAYLALISKLAYVQIAQHNRYVREATTMRRRTIPLDAPRGVLLDRNGTLLVQNEPAATIVVDPNSWGANLNKKKHETFEGRKANALAQLQTLLPGVNVAAEIEKRAGSPIRMADGKWRYRTVDVARRVPVSVGNAVNEAVKTSGLVGVTAAPDTIRRALNGDLAPQVVGFTGQEGGGLDGLERSMQTALDGKPGFVTAEFDRSKSPIPGTETTRRDPAAGRDVVLTLDANLQEVAETALGKVFATAHADAATAIILDPRTGDILALANRPTYNVNHREGASVAAHQNRVVSAPYEPGSTLKVITMSAALEEKLVTPDTHFYCGGGMGIGNRTIHCAHGEVHHDETASDVIRNSCNIATAQIAFKLGKQRMYEYERRFGFGEKTGAGLPGESRGIVGAYEDWSDIKQANVAFGQGISVTPLQLAAAYGAIANDGKYCRPRIVWGERDDKDGTLKEDKIAEPRVIVCPQTAQAMRQMLQEVVDHGTGTKARLPQWTAGGKTGTAQIAEHGHYGGKYVASFIGMAPMNHPQYVVLVAVTNPKGSYFGGEVAAPVFQEIMSRTLLARRVAPDKVLAEGVGIGGVGVGKGAKRKGGVGGIDDGGVMVKD